MELDSPNITVSVSKVTSNTKYYQCKNCGLVLEELDVIRPAKCKYGDDHVFIPLTDKKENNAQINT